MVEMITNRCNIEKNVLTKREKEVLTWVKDGKTNWEISVILKITERTVKSHMTNIMNKLDATTRSHAVSIALTQKIL